jgi:hypothetical protein
LGFVDQTHGLEPEEPEFFLQIGQVDLEESLILLTLADRALASARRRIFRSFICCEFLRLVHE